MPVTLTRLTTGSGVGASSFTTDTVTPTANALVLLMYAGDRTGDFPPIPTVSGGGMTSWVAFRGSISTGTPAFVRIAGYHSQQAVPGSGAITLDFAGTTQDTVYWSVYELNNVAVGSNGADAILQPNSASCSLCLSLNVPLAAFSSSNNATCASFTAYFPFTGMLPETGFTTIHSDTGLFTEFLPSNDTTPFASVSAGAPYIQGISWEVVFAEPGAPPPEETFLDP